MNVPGAASPQPGAAAPDTGSGYLRQIDALRLLAVLVVMFHHYLPDVHFPLFGKGVMLFFFLSGYFSTRQLLRLKQRMAEAGRPLPRAAGVFYARRYIRILPMYFGIVLAAAACDLPHARESLPWLATFTTNWHILLRGEWIGPFSPLWSLALLEQFYLFWPWLLLAVPRRWEVRAVLLLAAAAVLWRAGCFWTDQQAFMWFIMPWSGWDQLALGALAALLHARGAEGAPDLARLRRIGLLVAGPASLLLMFGSRLGGMHGFHYIYEPVINCLFFVWLVDAAARGWSGPLGRAMSNTAVCALGRASYTIFSLHLFTVFLIPPAARAWLAPLLGTNARWLALVPATLLLAWLAHRFVETPINRLKRFFTL